MEQPSQKIDLAPDIEWLCHATPLMATPATLETFTPANHLSDTTCAHSTFTYPLPPRYRLGRQFEDTVSLLLQHSPLCQQVLRNIVMTQDKQTLGELDCLYQDPYGGWVHLEIAIKFYLQTHPSNDLAAFVGPGGRDRLDIKWQRLLNHQLPLAFTPAAQQRYQALDIPPPVRQALLLTGVLFYPFKHWQDGDMTLPLGCHPDHQKGWWLYAHQLSDLNDSATVYEYVLLPRWHWIGGLKHPHQRLTFAALGATIESSDTPCMVIRCHNGKEESRGFVVHDSWPSTRP